MFNATANTTVTSTTSALTTTLPENANTTAANETTTVPNVTSTTERDITPTTAPVSSSTSNSTVNTTTKQVPNVPDSDSKMAIIGGCIGGVVFLLIIIVIVCILYKRRKGSRNRYSDEIIVHLPPSKDELMEMELQKSTRGSPIEERKPNSTKPSSNGNMTLTPDDKYANVTKTGDINEETDPAVANDGYLRKPSKQTGNHSDLKVPRQQSMPLVHAPLPPPPTVLVSGSEINDSYVTGRATDTKKEYVNLNGTKKGEPVFGISPKPMKKSKSTQQRNYPDYEIKESTYYNDEINPGGIEPGKVYENVGQDKDNDSRNYYNVQDNCPSGNTTEVFYDDA